jgi:flagellin-like protein
MHKKRGVSPVIATVLLIALVIVIAIIIFLWFKGMSKETIVKFETAVELVCDQVSFEADYSSNNLYISNTGNIPIYKMKIRIFKDRSYKTKELSSGNNWPDIGINQGEAVECPITLDIDVNRIILIPVLLGESSRGKQTHDCDEDLYGYEIRIS